MATMLYLNNSVSYIYKVFNISDSANIDFS